MKQILKLGITLALYAAISCFALAIVNNFTSPVIERHAQEKENEGLLIIFPEADAFEAIHSFNPNQGTTTISSLYKVIGKGEFMGYAVKASGPSYDTTTLLAGFDKDMNITGVHILETTDSPGFGQKAKDPSYKTSKGVTFYEQFAGVNAKNPLVTGTDFEAISGATITSNGVGAIISNAAACVSSYISETGGEK